MQLASRSILGSRNGRRHITIAFQSESALNANDSLMYCTQHNPHVSKKRSTSLTHALFCIILTSNVLTLMNRVFHRARSHIACDLSLCAGMTATFWFVPKESVPENREMSPRSMSMRVIVYVVLQIMNRCSWSSITNPVAISCRCHETPSRWLTPYGIAESCMNEESTATEQPVFILWECADTNHCYCTRCAHIYIYIYIYMCMKHKQCIEVSAPLVCARTRVAGAVCHN